MLSIDMGIQYDELLRMPSATFSLYKDLYSRKPWGDYRRDLQAAVVAQTVAAHAGKTRKAAATLSEFVLDFDAKGSAKEDPGIDLEAEFFPTNDD